MRYPQIRYLRTAIFDPRQSQPGGSPLDMLVGQYPSPWIFQTTGGGKFIASYEPNGEYGIVPWRLERSLPCSRCGGHRSPPGCSLTGTTQPGKEEVRVRFQFWICSLTLFPYWPRHHPSPDFSRIITWPSKKLQCSLSIIWIDKKTQHNMFFKIWQTTPTIKVLYLTNLPGFL